MSCFRLLGIATLLVSSSLAPWAQHAPFPSAPEDHRQQEEEIRRSLLREQQKKRYENVKRDSQKLLDLATELKQNVDKSGENILSIDVVRKAAEMEKLARRVKDNMRAN
jgi:hypothetical protein